MSELTNCATSQDWLQTLPNVYFTAYPYYQLYKEQAVKHTTVSLVFIDTSKEATHQSPSDEELSRTSE